MKTTLIILFLTPLTVAAQGFHTQPNVWGGRDLVTGQGTTVWSVPKAGGGYSYESSQGTVGWSSPNASGGLSYQPNQLYPGAESTLPSVAPLLDW